MQRLDARPDRRGDDEAREEQGDDEPDLPEREREHDDAEHHERRDECFACRIHQSFVTVGT